MLQSNFDKFEKLNAYLRNLWDEPNKNTRLIAALNLANEIIKILGIPDNEIEDPETILNKAFSNARFKNQKMETWFEKHPFFGSGRIALQHYDKATYPIETKFYQLNENFSKARVSATTQLEPNWEDNDLTMLPEYKIGIDFFLDAKARCLSIVITNQGNLRVLELSEKLTNTQIEIFNKIKNAFRLDGIEGISKEEIKFEPQRTIHRMLWGSFELKEVNERFYKGVSDLFEILSYNLENQEKLKALINDLPKQSKQFANRLIGRILFLWFLNKKGVISSKFNYFETTQDSTEYYNKKLKTLFYDVLNTSIDERTKTKDLETPYLNGGLFEPHSSDWVNLDLKFPEDWFKSLYEHLNQFNFTTDESSPEYEQVAIDPEMLGRVFENLLASIVPETSKAASERKNKGAFYTPRDIVSFMCKESLKEHIKNSLENEKDFIGVDKLIDMSDSDFIEMKSTGQTLIWGNRSDEVKLKIIDSLNSVKVFDPACGSGAFPIGFMQLMIKTLERLSTVYDVKTKKHRLANSNEKFEPHLAKLSILKNSLFGSDIEPMAVEISKLRAWLSLVIDEDMNIDPLPNLEFNFVCSNSLIPLPVNYQQTIFDDNTYDQSLNNLIEKYFNTHGLKEKLKLREKFNFSYDELSRNENLGERSKILRTWNPFKFDKAAAFFDSKIMLRVDKFDIIIGNPPYIGESGHKEIFSEIKLSTFGKKYYLGKMDYFYFFFHLGIELLKNNGILSFITTNYYLTADGARKLRQSLFIETNIIQLINFNELTVFESARGQHDLITVLRKNKNKRTDTKQISANYKEKISDQELKNFLKGKSKLGSNEMQKRDDLFSEIKEGEYNIRMKSSKFGIDHILRKISNNARLENYCQINQGIIPNSQQIYVREKGYFENLKINKKLIVPLYKNTDIFKWRTKTTNSKELLYVNSDNSKDESIINYLSRYKSILENRIEFANGSRNWVELHRAREKKIFESNKILVPYRSTTNNFGYNEIPWYTLTDVYILTNLDEKNNLFYLLGILNSKLIYTWLYYRGKRKGEVLELVSTPISQIPIPEEKSSYFKDIENLVKEILRDNLSPEETKRIEKRINDCVYNAFNLNENEIEVINKFWEEKHFKVV